MRDDEGDGQLIRPMPDEEGDGQLIRPMSAMGSLPPQMAAATFGIDRVASADVSGPLATRLFVSICGNVCSSSTGTLADRRGSAATT